MLDRLSFFGCQVRLEGDKLKVRGPDRPEVEGLVSELRRERDAAIAFLRDHESTPPSLDEIQASLPPGVKLVNYEPKQPPSLADILAKLADAGLELKIDSPGVPNVHGVVITNDDIPF